MSAKDPALFARAPMHSDERMFRHGPVRPMSEPVEDDTDMLISVVVLFAIALTVFLIGFAVGFGVGWLSQ